MQIDAHVHSDGSATHIRSLLKACDKVGTDKVILFNTGNTQEKPDEAIIKAYKKHTDRIIPYH